MHEMGVADRILSIALDAARSNGAEQIVRIRLRVGALAQVDQGCLLFACEVLGRGTAAEGATIVVNTVPARLRCTSCGQEAERDLLAPCAACGSFGGAVIAGRELAVESIDVAENAAPEPPPAEDGKDPAPTRRTA